MDREKETVELCSFAPCEHLPKWKLCEYKDGPHKVLITCDYHLAAGVHTLGAPVLVKEHVPHSTRKTVTMKAVKS